MQSTEGKTIRSTKWNAQRKEHSVAAFSQPFFLCIAHSIHIYICHRKADYYTTVMQNR